MPRLVPVLAADVIAARVAELGARITRDYRDKKLLVVGVLDGAFVFCADLCRRIDLPIECDFVTVRSYGDMTTSNGAPEFARDLARDVAGRHVLLVEDVVDSGRTADLLRRLLLARGPASLALCALIRKERQLDVDVPVEYLGFSLPDRFLVGYGLDHARRYRNLPYLAALEE